MGRRRSAAPAALALPSPSSSSASSVFGPAFTPQAPPNTPSDTGHAPGLQAAPHSRRQPVLLSRPRQSRRARCAEVAGGTAADCAAVCCCCPCGIINLVVLAVVKVPAGLCRRAFRKNKKRLTAARKSAAIGSGAGNGGTTRRGLLGPRVMDVDEDEDEDEDEFVIFTTAGGGGPMVLRPGAKGLLLGAAVGWPEEKSPSVEVSEMDKQMWAHFYGTGFWRSPSQKDA